MYAEEVPPLTLFMLEAHALREIVLIFERAGELEEATLLARAPDARWASIRIAVRPYYYLKGGRLWRIPHAKVRLGVLRKTTVLPFERVP